MAHAGEVYRILAKVETKESVELSIEETADSHHAESKRCRSQVKILGQVPGIEQNVSIATLTVLPHRAAAFGYYHDHEVDVSQHLLAQGHIG
jgi:hypothetical protein